MARTRRRQKSVGKLVAIIIAVVLLLAAGGCAGAWGAGSALTGDANPFNWFKTTTTEKPAEPRTVAVSLDGEVMQDGMTYDMPTGFTLLSERIGNVNYVANGEITLTAELSNEYINGKFDFSVDFKDPNSEWAQGKVATYYVGLEPSEDGRQVKVKFLAQFSEQIILTAKLRDAQSSDSCTIDCLKDAMLTYPWLDADFEDCCYVGDYIRFGEGTVTGDFVNGNVIVYLDEDFIDDVQDYLNFDIALFGNFAFSAEPTLLDGARGTLIEFEYDGVFSHGDFIEGFDDYDEAHKEAIYYAWFHAYWDNYLAHNKDYSNVLITVSVTYSFAGVVAKGLVESDIANGCIDGDYLGMDIEPSVTLNKNYVF